MDEITLSFISSLKFLSDLFLYLSSEYVSAKEDIIAVEATVAKEC